MAKTQSAILTTWNRQTPNDGLLLNDEFQEIYRILNSDIGTIKQFIIPVGLIDSDYIILDGRSVNKSDYPLLEEKIVDVEGFDTITNPSQIRVPNLNGYFLRYEESRSVGNLQNDSIKAHQHTVADHNHTIPDHNHTINHGHGITDPGHSHIINSRDTSASSKSGWLRTATDYQDKGTGVSKTGLTVNSYSGNSGTKTGLSTNIKSGLITNDFGEVETRPKNVAVIYAIKGR